METVPNTILAFRVASAFVALTIIGFVCGYYGPLYLLPDPGVGPITGVMIALPCGLVGAAAAMYASVRGFSRRNYVVLLFVVAILVVASSLALVVLQ